MIDKPHIMTAQEFIEGDYSLGDLGDIRTVSQDEAKANLARITLECGIRSGAIALLGVREPGKAGSRILPEYGLIHPIYPSPNEEEWKAFATDFRTIDITGQLHAYNRDLITLPI